MKPALACSPAPGEPSCKLFKFGVDDFDRQLIVALKLDPRCNGLPVLLANILDEAVKTREFMDTHLYLYVDYYPDKHSPIGPFTTTESTMDCVARWWTYS
jgi:hypothetical protein